MMNVHNYVLNVRIAINTYGNMWCWLCYPLVRAAPVCCVSCSGLNAGLIGDGLRVDHLASILELSMVLSMVPKFHGFGNGV
jgi:hypothetical protein